MKGASLVAQNRHPRDRRSTSEPTARRGARKGNAVNAVRYEATWLKLTVEPGAQ